MTDVGWARLDALLRGALDQPESDRVDWVRQECAGDTRLEKEVLELLEAGLADDELLRPAGAQLGEVWDDLLGSRTEAAEISTAPSAGPYRILSELGRGGMGTVYLAEPATGDPDDRVAVKVLRTDELDDEARRRFEQEREILASLDHPAIARHLGGGLTEDGRPYLVMELVEGRPITRFCDDLRLSVPDRLRLFLDAARAVQHAHRCMVVHRDIKPSNILVSVDRQVKLLDFGIAKLLEPGPTHPTEPLTRVGRRVMTPEYASPEQLRGDWVMTASDVYQLGLVMYELLTGRPPYDTRGRTLAEIERVVCDQPPTSPSAVVSPTGPLATGRDAPSPSLIQVAAARSTRPERLHRQLRGDLDLIVLKALRKEPARRYDSVEQLIQDVERHLEGRPISARRDSAAYRLRKFVGRHPLALAATATIAVLILALAGIWVERQAAVHRQARIEADRARQVAGFLEDMFDVARPGATHDGERLPAREILDRGAERLETDLAAQPQLQAELRCVLGEMYRKLGLYDRAQQLLEASLTARRELLDPTALDVAASLAALGRLFADTGQYVRAEPLLRQALDIREVELGPDHPDVARSLADLAALKVAAGRLEEAEPLMERSLAALEGVAAEDDLQLAKVLNGLSSLLWTQGRYDEAEPLLRRALSIYEASADRDPEGAAAVLSNLGQLSMRRGDLAAAETLLERGHEQMVAALGTEHPDVAMSLKAIARLHARTGRLDAARAELQQAVAILESAHDQDHPDLGACLNDLGLVYWRQGDLERAEPLLRRALTIGEATLGDSHPDVAAGLNSLAALYTRQGRYREAEPLYRRALQIMEGSLGPDHPHVATVLVNLGSVLRELDDPAGARQLLVRATGINLKALGADHLDVARCRTSLAAVDVELGDLTAAAPLVHQAIASYEAQLGPDHQRLVAPLAVACVLELCRGDTSGAEPPCTRALTLAEAALGSEHAGLVPHLVNQARLWSAMGRPADASALLDRALALTGPAAGAGDAQLATLLVDQAACQRDQGRLDRAEQSLRRVLDLTAVASSEDAPEQRLIRSEALILLGELETQQGQPGRASRHWSAVLELTADRVSGEYAVSWRRCHAVALLRLGRLEEARPLVAELRAAGYNHPQLERALAASAAPPRD